MYRRGSHPVVAKLPFAKQIDGGIAGHGSEQTDDQQYEDDDHEKADEAIARACEGDDAGNRHAAAIPRNALADA